MEVPKLCVPRDEVSYAIDHYRATYKPCINRAILHSLDVENKVLEVDVYALANLSPIFRTMPAPDSGEYDIDSQKFLQSRKDVDCFVSMCDNPEIPFLVSPYQPSPIDTWDFDSIVRAGRLCDFLGITCTRPIRDFAPIIYDQIHPESEHDMERKHRVIALHQIALKTNNTVLEKEMVSLMNKKPPLSHNARVYAINKAYAEFAWQSHMIDDKIHNLLVQHLGWKRGVNQMYGYKIALE